MCVSIKKKKYFKRTRGGGLTKDPLQPQRVVGQRLGPWEEGGWLSWLRGSWLASVLGLDHHIEVQLFNRIQRQKNMPILSSFGAFCRGAHDLVPINSK